MNDGQFITKEKIKIKVVVSNKSDRFEKRVNEEIEKLESEGYCVLQPIETNISYAGKEGYMILGTIHYILEEKYELEDICVNSTGINFGVDITANDNSFPNS